MADVIKKDEGQKISEVNLLISIDLLLERIEAVTAASKDHTHNSQYHIILVPF